jgi:hypothetical protein
MTSTALEFRGRGYCVGITRPIKWPRGAIRSVKGSCSVAAGILL